MKKLILLAVAITVTISHLFCQTPQQFNYQAVARSNDGSILSNQLVSFKTIVVQGSSTGFVSYSETHQTITNDFGVANLAIGNGSVLSGIFSAIDWSNGPYFLKVEMDASGGSAYQWMGTSQLLSVPYALYSENTSNTDDADADPLNELQTISKFGNTVTLSDAGGSFTDDIDDADADPTNELNASIILNGTDLEVTDAGGTIITDMTSLQDDADADPANELNTSVNLNGTDLEITDAGGTIITDMTNLQEDADADPTNELNTSIILNGTNLEVTDAGGTIITDLNSLQEDADADPTNELNTGMVLNGTSLEVTDAGGILAVDLGIFSEDNDWIISGDDMYSGVSGNVGIGTTTPGAPLEVSGRISQINTGGSVILGYNAGLNEDESSNYNVFVGHEAGKTNDGGQQNTGVGNSSLSSNTIGDRNTAIGGHSLSSHETGFDNTAVGESSLHDLTGGYQNTTIGANSQYRNISGNHNTAVGYSSLNFNETGNKNTAVGYHAGFGSIGSSTNGCVYLGNKAGYNNDLDNKLYIENSDSDTPLIYGEFDNDILAINGNLGIGTMTPSAPLDVAGRIVISNTNGSIFIGTDSGLNDDLSNNVNLFIGNNCGKNNVNGYENTAIGQYAMGNGTEYNYSTAFGYRALFSSTLTYGNAAFGDWTLSNCITGSYNTALGHKAMQYNETGGSNIAVGDRAMMQNTVGEHNTALGARSLLSNLSGSNNTTVGYKAGNGSTGESISGSVFIGYMAGSTENTSNKLYIENSDSDAPLIYGDFNSNIMAVNGNLGIGTHTPATKVHVVGGTDASLAGGGYILTGSTASENVVIDENEIMARNNGGVSSLQLQRDGGSLSVHYGLGEINEFRIRDDGKTGIGESFPNSKLHINTLSGENGFRVQINSATKFLVHSNGGVVSGHNVTTPTYAFQLLNNSINLLGRGRAFSWNTYSDNRLKSNQRTIEYGLEELLQLQPKSYDHHSSSTNEEGEFIMVTDQKISTVGFIAQEVQEIIPEAVCEPVDDNKDLWTMDYDKLIPILTKAIQEQQEMIEEQKVIIETIQLEVQALRNQSRE